MDLYADGLERPNLPVSLCAANVRFLHDLSEREPKPSSSESY